MMQNDCRSFRFFVACITIHNLLSLVCDGLADLDNVGKLNLLQSNDCRNKLVCFG